MKTLEIVIYFAFYICCVSAGPIRHVVEAGRGTVGRKQNGYVDTDIIEPYFPGSFSYFRIENVSPHRVGLRCRGRYKHEEEGDDVSFGYKRVAHLMEARSDESPISALELHVPADGAWYCLIQTSRPSMNYVEAYSQFGANHLKIDKEGIYQDDVLIEPFRETDDREAEFESWINQWQR